MAAELSETAKGYRTAMLAMILLAVVALAACFAGIKGWMPTVMVGPAVLLVTGAALGAAWMGLRGHRQVLLDRERASGQFMILAIAGQLGKQDDATLQAIAGKGGPAGEAARLILEGRAQKARPSVAAPAARPRVG